MGGPCSFHEVCNAGMASAGNMSTKQKWRWWLFYVQLVYRAAGRKQKSIFTSVPDTPDLLRAKHGQKLQSQVRLINKDSKSCCAGITEDGYGCLTFPGQQQPLPLGRPWHSWVPINFKRQCLSGPPSSWFCFTWAGNAVSSFSKFCTSLSLDGWSVDSG